MNKRPIRFIAFLIGFIFGILASIIVIKVFIMVRSNHLESQVKTIPTISVEYSQEEDIYNLLAKADQNLQTGKFQATIDLILPVVDEWPSEIDRSSGYQLLAIAEMNLDHPEKSIEYAQKMTELSPGSFSYQMLAQAYDGTGDLANALNAYQQMIQFNDGDSRSDFDAASARILVLGKSLGTTTP